MDACQDNTQLVAGYCISFYCESSESYDIEKNSCSSTCDYRLDDTGNRYCSTDCPVRYANTTFPSALQCVDACPLNTTKSGDLCVPKKSALEAGRWDDVECLLKFSGRVFKQRRPTCSGRTVALDDSEVYTIEGVYEADKGTFQMFETVL